MTKRLSAGRSLGALTMGLLMVGAAAPAFAQDGKDLTAGVIVPGPAPTPAQSAAPAVPQNPATQTVPATTPAEAKPVPPAKRPPRQAPPPQARVGVDESNPLSLSLNQAVQMALVRNRDIEIERINTQQSGYDVEAAKGYYDVFINSEHFFDRAIVPVASALGGGPNGRTETTTISSSVTLQKAFKSGGFVDVGATNAHVNTNNIFSSINPQDQTGLTLNFRQPLLRNFNNDENARRLRVANLRLDQSDAQFRARVIETVGAVQRGYWDLVFSLRNVQVARESVDLAEEQIRRLDRLVQEGINAPVEVVQVQAELERRRQNVFTALESVTTAENNLKSLVLADRTSPEWNRALLPTDDARVTPVTIELGEAVDTAIKNRPDLASLRVQEEINDVDVRYYRSQKKPQLDVFGSYGLTGLAGTQVTTPNPFTAASAAQLTRLNEISQQLGLDPLPPTTSSGVPSGLIGGYGSSLGNLFSNDYREVRVGVELNFSVQNRTAEANFGRAQAEGRKILAQRQGLEQTVEREVRNALQAVETARQRVDAAVSAREAAEIQLSSEQRRYEAGLSTTFLVLTRQNELSTARGNELQSLTDFNKAVSELQRVVGITLSANAIDVKEVKGPAEDK